MTSGILLLLLLGVCLAATYDERYLEVPLDHFSISKSTFKLRYLVYEQDYVKGGPTFFYCGNEADVKVFVENTGFLFDIAPVFNALVVFAEHRYYGASLPFAASTFSNAANMRYLTTSQALADFVLVIDQITGKYYRTMLTDDTYPVVAFGGSYGGMLAAWLRMKYPHAVIGAVASSAPVLQHQVPCYLFYQVVTNSFAKYDNCSAWIGESWRLLRNLSNSDSGKRNISAIFKLCKPLKTELDLSKMIDWLGDVYVDMAMVNYPYPTNFVTELPAHPVKAFCDKMRSFVKVNETAGLLDALAEALQVYTNATGRKSCNRYDTTPNDPVQYAWDYQACVELVMPMCSTERDMFEEATWDLGNYSKECYGRYGVGSPRPDSINLKYGGGNLRYASNILFTNGLMDPWSSGGVLSNISETVLSILIPDAVHHYDLRGAHATDSHDVIEARNAIVSTIKKWLRL
ncbi:lysosomal Pro-X carboxypeptidase-like [Cylas formicarius]|uniref:lysosomal Pro-X carboxypeptidase-like n=1 Tax=Cylas formicarius TaxID=197179 RepID=UPI002958B9D1|nr:lysosomal Pro-X carboxypeptidase-like [Cylas formicarius]